MPGQNKSVLIIEDNELNMKLFVAVLGHGRFRVFQAGDAQTGLHLAKEHHPDLILMDLQLPGMDGFQAASLLKQDETLKNIPVVALSGWELEDSNLVGESALFAGHIAKPIRVKDFIKSIIHMIPQAG